MLRAIEGRMGLLSELFVAREAEARDYDARSAGHFLAAQFGGLTNLEFEVLWSILDGEPWSPDKHALVMLVEGDESWTFRFPDRYVEQLRRLGPEEISAAARAWAATDEISVQASDVEPVITELTTLAASVNDDQGLYLWGSL